MTQSIPLKKRLQDNKIVRSVVRSMFSLGDDVRPIVQKPRIREYLGTQHVGRALDAGCGRGMYTRLLVPLADHVEAFDFAPKHIERNLARKSEFPNVTFQVASATEIPFPDNSFDLVLHSEVLEHIPDDRKALSELNRVLKPGCRLILSTPILPAPYYDKEHVREGYEPDALFALMQSEGFEIKKHEFCMFKQTRAAMLRTIRWNETFPFPMPNLLLLPLYWERAVSKNWGRDKVPFDIIIEAIKVKKQ